ncbi:hypothetical protein B0H13DRAFT_2671116 [Mycena leptocephala]|nr:hypothetical protein B0H13DRAFT_2671116 [Mycena leptocephala]
MGSLRRPRKKAKKRGRVTRTFGEIAGTLAFIARNFALPSVSFAGTLATGCQVGRELPAGDGGCDGRVSGPNPLPYFAEEVTDRGMSKLAADRARIAALAARIEHLERSLAALRTEKALAEKPLDDYKYPVLTLPNEIISEIFLHFLPNYPSAATYRNAGNSAGIHALWRAIAFWMRPTTFLSDGELIL